MKNCTLEEALDYQNEDVISRFVGLYNIPEEQASILFEETKKWLWLCYKAVQEKKMAVVIDDSLLIIDEMWHNFILFTKDYETYCHEKFGYYIHHQPTKKADKLKWRENINESLEEYFKNIEKQYSYIFDNLGKETLTLWYEEFPSKYSKKQMKELLA